MSKRYWVSTIVLSIVLFGSMVVANRPLVVEAHSNTITMKDKVAEESVVNEEDNVVVVPVIEEKVVEVEKQVINSPFPLKRVGVFNVKGYCTCSKCKPIKNNPRSIREVEGVNVIADLSIIPEGTMLWIDGVGIRQVQPSSRVTKGNNIIVYFDNHEDVVKFGFSEKIVYKIMN